MAAVSGDSREQRYGAGLLDHQIPLERRRLQALEAFADPATCSVIESRGIKAGWRCLELGGGAGSIARWLAARCAPGQVVATDIDTRLLPDDIPNLSPLRHNVINDDFPEAAFDLVHARALLEHLPEREEVLARMAHWTAAGGWVSVDGVIIIPPVGSPQNAYHRCINALITLTSGPMQADFRWATALPGLLTNLGLEDIDLHCTPGLVGRGHNADALLRLTLEQTGPAMTRQGLITQHDLTTCAHLLDTPGYTDLAFLLLSISGRRK
ncbi:methyltransferase [Streptomyces sp. ET3-23]|uniref:class I SAM-dependent methyltransferase n=1 Tax=Streptomyces sp. ET3-23 TaxID=2885643 RepID=UPI001D110182|nr:class I SAM-dependent methyltransferase [Streptomyces sp. ET3-23]MCC2275215.1 methyltransferase [Streptomyces sp. ET3-23]